MVEVLSPAARNARRWYKSERIVNFAWHIIDEDVKTFKLLKEDVIRSFSVVLERRSYFPDLPKNVIVGCGRVRKSPRRPCWSDELPIMCSKSCVKEKRITETKILVECSPCEEDCSICLEPLSSDTLETSCGHKFHNGCIYRVDREKGALWFKCPLCRHTVSAYTIEEIQENFDFYKECRCCARHQEKRPNVLSSDARWKNTPVCGSGLSIVLRKLLDYSDHRDLEKCKCRGEDYAGASCRSILRGYCRLLQ
jgi:hypothetical protein